MLQSLILLITLPVILFLTMLMFYNGFKFLVAMIQPVVTMDLNPKQLITMSKEGATFIISYLAMIGLSGLTVLL